LKENFKQIKLRRAMAKKLNDPSKGNKNSNPPARTQAKKAKHAESTQIQKHSKKKKHQ